jgi:hypothetical protein
VGGTQLRFADGTSARVYRETVADRGATLDPCVLVVEFRLRAVRGLGHAAGRELRASPVAGARPGVGAGLDPLRVLPGLRRDEMLDRLHLLGGDDAWWRLTSVG